MRGNIWCDRHEGFAAIRKLKNELVKVEIAEARNAPETYFGASSPASELVARQFVIERFGGGLNRALFEYLGSGEPIRMAMPRQWRDYLAANGWKVNHRASARGWRLTVLARFAQGLLQAVRLCGSLWRGKPAAALPNHGLYVAFESLTLANLPPEDSGRLNYDICSFYARWPGRLSGVATICHGVAGVGEREAEGLPVRYCPPAWELASGRRNALRLARWLAWASLVAGVQILAGRWHYGVLFAEAARARAVRMCAPSVLAREYLIHASGSIYRPMWTYEAQRLGSNVSLYFYSTFVQPKLASGYESQAFEWGPANWPRYIVWDSWQEAMLRGDLGDQIQVTQAGAITFSDSGKQMPMVSECSIAVFSMQPFRPSAHFGISTLADCLAAHPDYYSRFLKDVVDAVAECGGTTILKEKRDISGRGDKCYERVLDEVVAMDRVRVVDPAISAVRVIKACCASVSIPFTSTALYGKELGVPSAYYDPAGWMQPGDLGAHGIPVLRGADELKAWLGQVLARAEPR